MQGINSVIVTDVNGAALGREQAEGKRHYEVWVNFPDFPRDSTVTHKPGDPRAAIAPLLAARALGGNFSWLLFGDVRRFDVPWFPLDAHTHRGPGCYRHSCRRCKGGKRPAAH